MRMDFSYRFFVNHSSFLLDRKSQEEKQFEAFLKDMRLVGKELSVANAKAFRKKYMQDNFSELYRDDIDLYLKHVTMPIKKFMSEICSYKKPLSNSKFQIQQNPFREGNMIYGLK